MLKITDIKQINQKVAMTVTDCDDIQGNKQDNTAKHDTGGLLQTEYSDKSFLWK